MISEGDKARLQVGFKQTLRAVNEGNAEKVFLAGDCDEKICTPVEDACRMHDVSVLYVSTMTELGSLCEIEVKASCAVVLK